MSPTRRTPHWAIGALALASLILLGVYERLGMVDKAIDYYNRALGIFEGLGDKVGLAYIYSSLATFYQSQKSYVKAEEMSKRALELRREEELWAGVAFSYLELAKIYSASNKNNLAFETLLVAIVVESTSPAGIAKRVTSTPLT